MIHNMKKKIEKKKQRKKKEEKQQLIVVRDQTNGEINKINKTDTPIIIAKYKYYCHELLEISFNLKSNLIFDLENRFQLLLFQIILFFCVNLLFTRILENI